jgi:hypothetical protein
MNTRDWQWMFVSFVFSSVLILNLIFLCLAVCFFIVILIFGLLGNLFDTKENG